MAINSVSISGNLTRDADVQSTGNGKKVIRFTVAVDEKWKNISTGEWEDHANFFDCVGFGDRWEKLSNYLEKGTKVAISGKLRWSQWESDGQKRSKVEIIANDLEFLGKKEPKQERISDEDIPF